MWGGQSIPQYDYALAPYVLKSYKKHLKKLYLYACEERNIIPEEAIITNINEFKTISDKLIGLEFLSQKALEYTEEDTFQGAESLVHNLNSMASRAGSQVPFSSLNFGLDISPEGRMVSKNLLK